MVGYVLSLSRDVRANCWGTAEKAGRAGLYQMQALLGRYRWRWQDLRAGLAGLAAACLPDDPEDLIGPGIVGRPRSDVSAGPALMLRNGVRSLVYWGRGLPLVSGRKKQNTMPST